MTTDIQVDGANPETLTDAITRLRSCGYDADFFTTEDGRLGRRSCERSTVQNGAPSDTASAETPTNLLGD